MIHKIFSDVVVMFVQDNDLKASASGEFVMRECMGAFEREM
jgi:hypothetical protein